MLENHVLQALLRTLGPHGEFGQFHWPSCGCTGRERDHVDKTVYTMSESTLSSIGNHGYSTEMQELEPLTMLEPHDRDEGGYHGNRYRQVKPSCYEHTEGIASSSSEISESPPPMRTSDSPVVAATCRNCEPPLGRTAREHLPCTWRMNGTPSVSDYSDTISDVSSDGSCMGRIKRHTPHEGAPHAQPSVQLFTSQPEEPETKESLIKTDSNSNRTDVNTDKLGSNGENRNLIKTVGGFAQL